MEDDIKDPPTALEATALEASTLEATALEAPQRAGSVILSTILYPHQ
jgi:hypothetical protein